MVPFSGPSAGEPTVPYGNPLKHVALCFNQSAHMEGGGAGSVLRESDSATSARCAPLRRRRRSSTPSSHTSRRTAKLDAVRTAIERTIALLNERPAALIATSVTGQLDVKNDRTEKEPA